MRNELKVKLILLSNLNQWFPKYKDIINLIDVRTDYCVNERKLEKHSNANDCSYNQSYYTNNMLLQYFAVQCCGHFTLPQLINYTIAFVNLGSSLKTLIDSLRASQNHFLRILLKKNKRDSSFYRKYNY